MKRMLLMLVLMSTIPLIGCNFIEENKAKNVAKTYYHALMDEDYEKAFEQLYLYDHTEENHPADGTTLSEEEAEKFYMKKVDYIKEQDYKVKGFDIENIRYEDGHTFFLEMILQVEQDGENFERSETVDIWEGQAWIIEEDDPFSSYRDGNMSVEIEKVLE
ncbi:hypothetical protein [Alteribacillus sp. YIM 98480]|uniref:hypothetical protein n=1 Tax=Alteribacillus sp. YIM 98480 TaxID=2606599 RepID=UPI00131C2D5A|nr:hypothetical protein [Alteribacillus sp. YIM 98480]